MHRGLAGLAVDHRPDVVFGPILRARGLAHGIFHGLDDQFAFDQLLACDRIGDLQQLQLVGGDHVRRPLSYQNHPLLGCRPLPRSR